jgi:glycerol dehydrogenase
MDVFVYGMANYPLEELYEYIDFCVSIGIPVTFEELGIKNEPVEELIKAAQLAASGPTVAITTAKLTKEDLYKSMLVAESLVTEYLER